MTHAPGIILATLVLIACGLVAMGAQKVPDIPGEAPTEYDRALIAIEKAALNDAYKAQIAHLFEVWMRDATGQPGRAVTGAKNARRAYIDAMRGIERREREIDAR